MNNTNTLPPSTAANASVAVAGNTLHFTFGLPRGNDGRHGSNGSIAAQGPPGESSLAQLNNTNGLSTLDTGFADPDMEALRQKVNEMILYGRR